MIRRCARLAVRLAARLLPPQLTDWGRAMAAEVDGIDQDRAALGYALGCLGGALHEAFVHPDPSSGLERHPMPAPSRLNPRRLAVACAIGAIGLGLAYLWAAGASLRHLAMNGGALALGLLLAAGISETRSPGRLARGGISLALGAVLLLTALFGISADGVTRWVSVGGLSLQPSLILLPVLTLEFARRRDGLSTLAIAVAALALALQPDRAMAGALAAGVAALAIMRSERNVLLALTMTLAGLAATLLRADPSPAVPFVDQIFYSSFDVHPLAGLAVLGGAALMLVPAIAGLVADPENHGAYAVFGAVWLAVIAAAALGNYPTPLVGYGGSAIVGYLLSLTGLPARSQNRAVDRDDVAVQPAQADSERHLRTGLPRPIQFSGAPSSSRIAAKSSV
jgi:hypothetical protein